MLISTYTNTLIFKVWVSKPIYYEQTWVNKEQYNIYKLTIYTNN